MELAFKTLLHLAFALIIIDALIIDRKEGLILSQRPDHYFLVRIRGKEDAKRLGQALIESKGNIVMRMFDGRLLVNAKKHGVHFSNFMRGMAEPYNNR